MNWYYQKFLYWTEVQLGTLDRLQMRKGTSKYDLRRQQSIVDEMVADCREILKLPENKDESIYTRLLHSKPRLQKLCPKVYDDK